MGEFGCTGRRSPSRCERTSPTIMLRTMTHHDLHNHQHTGHDEQLAAWVAHHKQQILTRINHVHASLDELHSEHAAEPWWTSMKPVFQDIAQPAIEVTTHLTEI